MTTKERILQEALNLFSNNGFEAVSMRDIGAAVGIRESSIYKHYAGKQAILDEIVARAMEKLEHMLVRLHVPDPGDASVFQYVDMNFEDIAALCTNMLLEQRENEFVSKFRRLLTIEQYRNEKLRKIYIGVFMERQLAYVEKVFEYLLGLGVLQGSSAKILALGFFSPFFLLSYKLQDEKELLERELREYAVEFLKAHLREKKEP